MPGALLLVFRNKKEPTPGGISVGSRKSGSLGGMGTPAGPISNQLALLPTKT
jgi:hypothetical protein